jgi:AcrR family transcriptional regulator
VGAVVASIRREQAEATRAALLDAAAHEFWLNGLAGTRLQDVLDRAGVAKGSLYHHFRDKAQMAQSIIDSTPWEPCLTRLATAPTRGLAAIEAFSCAVAEHSETDVRARALIRIAHELDNPGIDSGTDAWERHLAGALQQAIADGDVPDTIPAQDVAAAITAALCGEILAPAPRRSLSDRINSLWTLLRPGVAAGIA